MIVLKRYRESIEGLSPAELSLCISHAELVICLSQERLKNRISQFEPAGRFYSIHLMFRCDRRTDPAEVSSNSWWGLTGGTKRLFSG